LELKKIRIKGSLEMNNKETLLYMYIHGPGNRENYLRGVVPYRINNEEIFYGACKRNMREKIKSLWEERNNEKNKMPKIYIVGINPAKSLKPRKILFAGEVLEIFSFKEAWNHYDQIIQSNLNDDYKSEIEKMRIGVGEAVESPLHLKPILNDEGILIGYKHRTNMHKHDNEWIKDLLSDKERNLFEKTIDDKFPKEIYKKEKISFKRDICFKLKNIHISFNDENQCPIDLTDEMFKLIEPAALKQPRYVKNMNLKKPDITSPLGYNDKNGKNERYGRGHIILRNAEAEKFIQLLLEKK